MRAINIKETLKALYSIRRTVCIEGPPGGGKTTLVHEVADELGVPCIERHMPTMLVEDFGILFPDGDGKLSYKLPDWYPVKGQAPENGILLFDDRNQAAPDLQKVLANICQARTLHGVSMPDGWMVVSTGNRQSDRAGANRVLSHLRNRETVIELDTSLDDWTPWALSKDVKPELVSFLHFRPDLLHDFDPQKDANPTPRSWVEGVSNILGLVPQTAEYEVIKGAVGESAASEFVAYLRVYRDLPDLEQVFKDPEGATVPREVSAVYAVVGALANRVKPEQIPAFLQYLKRLPPEYSVLGVSSVIAYNKARDVDILGHPASCAAMTEWMLANHKLIT
jgi:hypothetical protein